MNGKKKGGKVKALAVATPSKAAEGQERGAAARSISRRCASSRASPPS